MHLLLLSTIYKTADCAAYFSLFSCPWLENLWIPFVGVCGHALFTDQKLKNSEAIQLFSLKLRRLMPFSNKNVHR
jgi:hypothetical protein